MDTTKKVKSIIEALLMVSESGLTKQQLKEAITDSDAKDIDEGIRLLKEDYESTERAFNIAEIAGRYRIVTKPEFMPWINNLYQKDVDRLTGPSLETLAITAYKQPATRSEIEAVRGVNVGGVIKTLLDKSLITVRGRKNVIGRPLMYGTTQKFLEIFGLNSLDDLPALRDFSEEDLEYGKPQEMVEVENEGEKAGAEPETVEAIETEENISDDSVNEEPALEEAQEEVIVQEPETISEKEEEKEEIEPIEAKEESSLEEGEEEETRKEETENEAEKAE